MGTKNRRSSTKWILFAMVAICIVACILELFDFSPLFRTPMSCDEINSNTTTRTGLDIKGESITTYYWVGKRPIVREILACFGPPTDYDAYTYQDITKGNVLYLWYGNKGILIHAITFAGTDTSFKQIIFQNAGNPNQEVYRMIKDIHSTPEAWSGMQLKPWPGSLQNITVEEWRSLR